MEKMDRRAFCKGTASFVAGMSPIGRLLGAAESVAGSCLMMYKFAHRPTLTF